MRKRQHAQKSYFAPGEVADMLMVSPATVRNWASRGELAAVSTPGGHRRFLRQDVERFARENNLTIQLPDDDVHRVLIVDDDVQVAAYLSRFLGQVDASVATMEAHDGYTAGRLVQAFRPHVVLLDLMMPGLNGFDVCRQIKNDPATRATRIIAMTGYYNETNVARALQAGAEHCIAKPYDQQQLLSLLGVGEYRSRSSAADRSRAP